MEKSRRTANANRPRSKATGRRSSGRSRKDWYQGLIPAWRILLPFVLFVCVVAVTSGFVSAIKNAKADVKDQRDVVTIVFVEGDIAAPTSDSSNSHNAACSSEKIATVWKQAENVLDAFWKRAVTDTSGRTWRLWMYSLNGNPGAGKELVRLGPQELSDVRSARGITRTRREQEGWKKYSEAARIEYERSLEQHPRQDIVTSIRFLLNNRHRFIGDDVGVIKLVYVSDMLHYNCDVDAIDPEAGYWSFLNLDSVEKFQSQIDQGILYHHDGDVSSVNVPVEPLVNETEDRSLEVYSISVPRLTCESVPSQEVNRIMATGLIHKTWEQLFEKMNAKSVFLNVDVERVFD